MPSARSGTIVPACSSSYCRSLLKIAEWTLRIGPACVTCGSSVSGTIALKLKARRAPPREPTGSGVAAADGVEPEECERDRVDRHRGAVGRGGDVLMRAVAEVFGEERRRERHERHAEQQEQIADDQGVVATDDVAEHRVMVRPHDADD